MIFNVEAYLTLKSSIWPSIYVNLIVKSGSDLFWNQSVLCNEDKVSCSRKQRTPLINT